MTNPNRFHLIKEATLGYVVLNVLNVHSMLKFYQNVIGLTVFEQSDTRAVLGVDHPLLILEQIQDPLPLAKKTGLYHMAFLVPSRAALGDALHHYLTKNAPLVGASDHGYSEALYLTDPEENGIEVYWDKPRTQWDIREDGEIRGITIEMDAQGVLEARTGSWNGFSKGTTLGHVHLKVSDLEQTDAFYTEGLGLTLTSNFGRQAKFFAAGDYHHHIGANIWIGEHIPAMNDHDLGLAYYVFFIPTKEALEQLEKHWQTMEIAYTKDEAQDLWVNDPNGITIKFELARLS